MRYALKLSGGGAGAFACDSRPTGFCMEYTEQRITQAESPVPPMQAQGVNGVPS
jgi:hypothetical protein